MWNLPLCCRGQRPVMEFWSWSQITLELEWHESTMLQITIEKIMGIPINLILLYLCCTCFIKQHKSCLVTWVIFLSNSSYLVLQRKSNGAIETFTHSQNTLNVSLHSQIIIINVMHHSMIIAISILILTFPLTLLWP